jgi:hypothetical protein
MVIASGCAAKSSAHDPAAVPLPPSVGMAAVVVAPTKGEGFHDSDAQTFGLDTWRNALAVDRGTLLISRYSGSVPGGTLQEIDLSQRRFSLRLSPSDPGFADDSKALGEMAEADGSLVQASCGEIDRQAKPGGYWQRIAGRGCEGTEPRADGEATPATAPASDVHLSRQLHIIGLSGDGAILITDLNVIWSLHQSTATKLYEAPNGEHVTSPNGAVGAVGPRGQIVFGELSPSANAKGDFPDHYVMKDLRVLTSDGRAAPLDVPASIAGVTGDPRELAVGTIVSDGGDGFFYRVGDPSPDGNQIGPAVATHNYVLHQQGGHWSVVAASHGSVNQQTAAKWPSSGQVAATAIPVQLPVSMAVLPGMLVLSDGLDCNYALAIGLPR